MKIIKKHSWNTGRRYNSEGQPITAWVIGLDVYDAVILFEDSARMITGLIQCPCPHLVEDSDYTLEQYTMMVYDFTQYESGIRVSPKVIEENFPNRRHDVKIYETDLLRWVKEQEKVNAD